MAIAILDDLQSLDVDTKSTFADSNNTFNEAKSLVTQQLGDSATDLPINPTALVDSFTTATQDVAKGQGQDAIPIAPLSVSEIKTQITGQLSSLTSLNAETLQQAIPAAPGAETMKGLNITTEVNNTVSNLASAITGNEQFGKLDLPADQTTPFSEFQEFLNNAGALPGRILDAILTVLKKFFDKLSRPEAWLEGLSSEVITEIFVEQLRELTQLLPNQAVSLIQSQLDQRTQLLIDYKQFLIDFNPRKLTRPKAAELRRQVKDWFNEIEVSTELIDRLIVNLGSFNLDAFQTLLTNLPNNPEGAGQIGVISKMFEGVENFLNGLDQRIATVTEQLQAFTQKVIGLIEQAITKASTVGNKIIDAIAEKIEFAGRALEQVANYLKAAIAKLTDFVQQACDKSNEIVTPLKNACNQFANTTVVGIEKVAQTIQEKTQQIQQALSNVNQTIKTKLDRKAIEVKIRELLDQVTEILQSPAVKQAIDTADKGIDQVVAALQKISLDPAFDLAVAKTGTLETKLKSIDVSQLGTAQKAALKVGVKLIQQVDVPGIVNPELQATFDSVLDPVVDLVGSIQGEMVQIDQKVASFSPGTLAKNYLEPHINSLVNELNKYKPSILLVEVRNLYNTLLAKLEILNPNQLINLLESLYQKLVGVLEALSPKELTKFLNEKLVAITRLLDNLPIEQIVQKVVDTISNVEKLLSGLGLDNVLNSSFWKTLEDVLSFQLQDKIEQVDAIKDEVIQRVNNIDQAQLSQELKILREAIAQFAEDPQVTLQTAQTALETSWAACQKAAGELETQWAVTQEQLKSFTPNPEVAVDYRDLMQRMTNLRQRLVMDLLQAQITREQEAFTAFKAPTKTKLKALVKSSNARTDAEIIQGFQQAIPNEIEAQLTGPIKRILGKLDSILTRPREVLADIGRVIQRLASAPQELTSLLKKLVDDFGKILRGAVDKVKGLIQQFNFNFLDDLHRKVVDTIKELSPMRVLNSFYGASDFKGGSFVIILERLRQSTPDPVSEYFWSGLDESQQTILQNLDSIGAQNIVLQRLNQILIDPLFYSSDRFQFIADQLTQEANTLIAQLATQKPQDRELARVVRLNRLLLEAVYANEIMLSVQSIYPLFLQKLGELYPTQVVAQLDQLHAKIVKLIQDIPQLLELALNEAYQRVVAVYQTIRERIDRIFQALIARLYGLESELGIGLEDISDAYNRLLVALPV